MLFHITHSKLVRDGVGIIWKRPYTTFRKRSMIYLLVHLLLNVVISRVLWLPVSCNHTCFSLIGIVRLMRGFSLKPFLNTEQCCREYVANFIDATGAKAIASSICAVCTGSPFHSETDFVSLSSLDCCFFIPDVHISSQTLQDSEFSLIGDIQSVCLFSFHVASLGESIQLLGPVGSPSPANLLKSLLPPYIAVF